MLSVLLRFLFWGQTPVSVCVRVHVCVFVTDRKKFDLKKKKALTVEIKRKEKSVLCRLVYKLSVSYSTFPSAPPPNPPPPHPSSPSLITQGATCYLCIKDAMLSTSKYLRPDLPVIQTQKPVYRLFIA